MSKDSWRAKEILESAGIVEFLKEEAKPLKVGGDHTVVLRECEPFKFVGSYSLSLFLDFKNDHTAVVWSKGVGECEGETDARLVMITASPGGFASIQFPKGVKCYPEDSEGKMVDTII